MKRLNIYALSGVKKIAFQSDINIVQFYSFRGQVFKIVGVENEEEMPVRYTFE